MHTKAKYRQFFPNGCLKVSFTMYIQTFIYFGMHKCTAAVLCKLKNEENNYIITKEVLCNTITTTTECSTVQLDTHKIKSCICVCSLLVFYIIKLVIYSKYEYVLIPGRSR